VIQFPVEATIHQEKRKQNSYRLDSIQGCQTAYFQTKNPNLGKFLERLAMTSWLFGYFTVIWYILWPFLIFCGHLVYFSRFGMLHQEK
jgi:hypothetical protein